jgi:hypothetical protein
MVNLSLSLSKVAFIILLFSAACNSDKFDNPLDPNSPAYIPPLEPDKIVLIDNYDNGKKPNLLGCCYENFGNGVDISYDSQSKNILRGVGYSRQIDFDVSREENTSGGYVEMLTGNIECPSPRGLFNLEVLYLNTLTFWAKLESPDINMEVALKDIGNHQTTPKRLLRDYLAPSMPDTGWVKVEIPISELRSAQDGSEVDFQNLREINFGFANELFQKINAPLKGTIYIDEIAFER